MYTIKRIARRIKNVARTYFYAGDQVACLLCGWQGKLFFERGLCPHCYSLPRTRLIPYSLRFFGVNLDGARLLHIGPNIPEYDFLRKTYSMDCYDRIDLLPRKITNMQGDITQLDMAGSTYDAILIWHVFEHIPDDRKAIHELYRVLKPGGKLIVSVPIYPPYRQETYEDVTIDRARYEEVHGHLDHCRSCGLDYSNRFEEAGFKTETLEVRYRDERDRAHYGLNPGHVSWMFTKGSEG